MERNKGGEGEGEREMDEGVRERKMKGGKECEE